MHRLVKQLMDNGTAATVAEAEAIFHGYKLVIGYEPDDMDEAGQQSILLTCVALAKRVFLGGVTVVGNLSAVQKTPLPLSRTLRDAVLSLGAAVEPEDRSGSLRILIGRAPAPTSGFAVRAVASGWRGGIVPSNSPHVLRGSSPIPPAAMLAAALAVNEAFLHVNGTAPVAGRRSLGLSLWNLEAETDWLVDDPSEPPLTYLPSSVWLIGLGHLGQAYLWGLGLLPYADAQTLKLVLQDTDGVTPSTESTSILTDTSMVGQRKTRVLASWAERRGFQTEIQERLFGAWIKRQNFEPTVALCGIDNALGRRALDQAGFDLVLEAGLGRGHRDFRTMRIHSFPGSRSSEEIWTRTDAVREDTTQQAAYGDLLKKGALDQCGITLLAGKAVGAPFVGATAAALVLSELLRVLHGGILNQLIDVDLLSLEHRAVVPNRISFHERNLGFATARRPSGYQS
ncbi:thiamine biosynthesis protein ThiF [Acidipila rosea]|uniref:thiamine biosynthesis protein ThiF n=1 Tax=Acidipila rosea TaxID=768535 RepID=UPI001042C5F0|nr:thiamine biosynthesis protein ThiF [Acidipila rosea]